MAACGKMKNKRAGFWGTSRAAKSTLLLAAALVCLVSLLGADKSAGPAKLDGFVYDSCGGCFTDSSPCKPCRVVLELEGYLYAELDRLGARSDFQVEVHNVLYDREKGLLFQQLPRGLPEEIEYPVLLLDGMALRGWGQIKKDLASMVLSKTGRESPGTVPKDSGEIQLEKAGRDTVVYFKMQSCASCQKTAALLDGLFQKYSQAELVTYDISGQEDLKIFQAYCEAYGLDAENTYVPVVFIGDRGLEGLEEIQLFLEAYLAAGHASGTYRIQ